MKGKNEFEQHREANAAVIGTIVSAVGIILGKKMLEKRNEKKEKVILETDNYKI